MYSAQTEGLQFTVNRIFGWEDKPDNRELLFLWFYLFYFYFLLKNMWFKTIVFYIQLFTEVTWLHFCIFYNNCLHILCIFINIYLSIHNSILYFAIDNVLYAYNMLQYTLTEDNNEFSNMKMFAFVHTILGVSWYIYYIIKNTVFVDILWWRFKLFLFHIKCKYYVNFTITYLFLLLMYLFIFGRSVSKININSAVLYI